MRNCFFGERIKVQFNTFIGLNMVIMFKKKARKKNLKWKKKWVKLVRRSTKSLRRTVKFCKELNKLRSTL